MSSSPSELHRFSSLPLHLQQETFVLATDIRPNLPLHPQFAYASADASSVYKLGAGTDVGVVHLWKSEIMCSLPQTSRSARSAVPENWRRIYWTQYFVGPGRLSEAALVVVDQSLRAMTGPRNEREDGLQAQAEYQREDAARNDGAGDSIGVGRALVGFWKGYYMALVPLAALIVYRTLRMGWRR